MFEFEKYLKHHKILILDGSKRLKKYSNITIDTIYRPLQKKWERDLRKVYEHTTFLDRSRWYGDWKYNVEEYETIIIINGIRGRDVIEFIQAKNPNARIIIYYETTIDRKDRKAPCYYEGLGCEFYSFDKYDCKIWGLKYNHYYYDYYDGDIDDLRRAQKHHNINYDLFFCGYDKKRLASLISLHENLKRLGIKDKFVIVATL